VFVTGESWNGERYDYATVAYSAATGRRLWADRSDGQGRMPYYPSTIAVSPDGRSVFVTGSIRGGPIHGHNYATVAYDAATGRRLWASRYKEYESTANSLAVSPDGAMVFVTGTSQGAGGAATVAYSAATGRQLWVGVYDLDARSMAVSPDGTTVYVVGGRESVKTATDWATVAYRAATGKQLWASSYSGRAHTDDWPFSVAVSPAGGMVFVSGYTTSRGTNIDYTTIAYSAATGRRQWLGRYNGPGNGTDSIESTAVSPAGDRVFVTGFSKGKGTGLDYATVAYSAVTGRRLWASRYNGPGNRDDDASSVAVSPAGDKVFVTGPSKRRGHGYEYATVAYSAATGRQLWVSHYGSNSGACCVAVSPDGATVFVTGGSGGGRTGGDYATIAYRS
jgi:DNA-binding beta-propeller fold protein YncE